MATRPQSAGLRGTIRSRSAPALAIKYQWEGSIPYNWKTISDVPLEKVRPRTSQERNAYEALYKQRDLLTDICQPVPKSHTVTPLRLKPCSQSKPDSPALPKPLFSSPATKRPRENPATAKILNISFRLKASPLVTLSASRYAFPKSRPRRNPLKMNDSGRAGFRNRSIEAYLGRFERKPGVLSRVQTVAGLGR